ncbi:MAG: peptide chain release factor 2 [Candidatus Neomarinimicrobiota bacterium]|nr:MAG: peptide chain release factor 2 [Candidatus Neomarinimicrobiota bacterium]
MILSELQTEISDIQPRLNELRRIFDVDNKQRQLKELQQKSTSNDFWDNRENAQNILQKISLLESSINNYKAISKLYKDAAELVELLTIENDESLLPELTTMVTELKRKLDKMELQAMLSDEDDPKNAIMTIHPGAGGTESQDWAEMLMRMYLRWIERSGMESKIINLISGDEAGIKDVSIEVKGLYAYGYLKAEAGIHRLVRISPFDANHRRHTSFASVFVYPEIDENIEVDINPDDLRIDTYRASGAGGQHVNKTDSAIRITHIPTGIVVQCQNERSQFKNKASAMKILRARLYQLKKEELEKEKSEIEKNKKDISWGNQIRSYVFQPYTMVKDHRTKHEETNIQAVMDGDIDEFLRQYLLWNINKE